MKTKSKAELRMIPIREVVVPKTRKRAAKEIKPLITSIRTLGLLNPITVTKDLVLVAGLHRLMACEILGHKQIAANILSIDQVDAELAEIDENLCRTELTELERGQQTARRKELYEARHPGTKRGVKGANASNRKQGKQGDANAPGASG